MSDEPKVSSEDNHTLLVQLGDKLSSLGTSFNIFAENQQLENRRLHDRIDASNASTTTAVDRIKDMMSAKGQINGTFIVSLVAALLAAFALFGGAANAYINTRLETFTHDMRWVEKLMDERNENHKRAENRP